MKNFKTISVAAAAMALSACATVSPELRQQYDQTQQTLQQQPVSVVSSGCLNRIRVRKNYIIVDGSEVASKAINQALTKALNAQGVAVNKQLTPLICGQKVEEQLMKMSVRDNDDSEVMDVTTYPITTSTNRYDDATNKAFAKLFNAVIAADRPKDKNELTDLELDNESLSIIKQLLGTNKVFVVSVDGSKPTFAASMTVGAATALASGGAYVSTIQQGKFYSVYLVNLETNQIEWEKLRMLPGSNVFKAPYPSEYTIEDILDPLYEK